jgi:signal transduction histidine kinase
MHANIIQDVAFEMRRSVYRLVHLIDNMLVTARIDAGLEEPCLMSTDIVALTASIAEAAGEYLRGSVAVSFSSITDSLTMPADAHKLSKILLNLLSNAAKHSPAGGCIHVSLETRPERVCISVSDEGCGIPKDRLNVLFDRFRPAESLARSSEGCGIGLSLTRSMVELLGGSIRAESRPTMGATFFVELPIASEESPAPCQTAESLSLEQQIQIAFSDVYPAGSPAFVNPSG